MKKTINPGCTMCVLRDVDGMTDDEFAEWMNDDNFWPWELSGGEDEDQDRE